MWGEPLGEKDGAREEFLRGEDESKPTKPSRQSKLVVLRSGVVGPSDGKRSGSLFCDSRTGIRRDGHVGRVDRRGGGIQGKCPEKAPEKVTKKPSLKRKELKW